MESNQNQSNADKEMYEDILKLLNLIRGRPYLPQYFFGSEGGKAKHTVYIDPDSFGVVSKPSIQQQLLMLSLVWREVNPDEKQKKEFSHEVWSLKNNDAYHFCEILFEALQKKTHKRDYTFVLPNGINHVHFGEKLSLLYEPTIQLQRTLLKKIWQNLVPQKNNEDRESSSN